VANFGNRWLPVARIAGWDLVVGEDRFDDLGPSGAERRESIGERLAERDRTHPEPGGPPRRPEVPRAGNKYAWVVGIVMLMGIAVLLWRSSIPNAGEGVQGPPKGRLAPAFAAPLATGHLKGEANVCQRRPCPSNAGPRPACEVRTPEALNVCALRDQPLEVLEVELARLDPEEIAARPGGQTRLVRRRRAQDLP